MIGVDARVVLAQMVQIVPGGYRTALLFVNNSVSTSPS